MHAFDHGVSMTIISANVRLLQELAQQLGLDKNCFLDKLRVRFHSLCSTLQMKHITLMSFVNQSIVDCLDTFFQSKAPGKKSNQPMVDATDVQRLMLALPFVLDGLACEEVKAFNAGKAPSNRVVDLVPEAIMAVNEWLHWYHMYRLPRSGVHICIYILINTYQYILIHTNTYMVLT